jgi:hypothetical protein
VSLPLALFGLTHSETLQLIVVVISACAALAAVANVVTAGRNEQRRSQPIVIAHEEGGRRFGPAAEAEWVVDTYLTSEGQGAAFNVRFGVEFNGVRYPYRLSTDDPETGNVQRVLRPQERRPAQGALSIPFDSGTVWGRAADSEAQNALDNDRVYWARYENARGQTWETINPAMRSARLEIRRVRFPARAERQERRERAAAAARDELWLSRALDELREGMTSPADDGNSGR